MYCDVWSGMKKETFYSNSNKNNINNSFLETQGILNSIDGWFSPASHAFFDIFLNYQKNNNVSGNLGEIGVWKGKSSSVLCKHLVSEEHAFLIDPFLDEKKEDVLRHIDRVCNKIPDNVHLLNYYSEKISKSRLLSEYYATFRFFHIDGCHTGENVYCDMGFANRLLDDRGILVVDDYFNYSYPQITEALYSYLIHNPYHFKLFLGAYNKAYLCRPKYYSYYYEYVLNNLQKEMVSRNVLVTINKTSSIGDSMTLSVTGFLPDTDPWTGMIGPDWAPEYLDQIHREKAQIH